MKRQEPKPRISPKLRREFQSLDREFDALLMGGYFLHRDGPNTRRAWQVLQRMIKIDPDNPEAWMSLSVFLDINEEYEESILAAMKSIDCGMGMYGWIKLVEVLAQSRGTHGALESLLLAVEYRHGKRKHIKASIKSIGEEYHLSPWRRTKKVKFGLPGTMKQAVKGNSR